MSSRRPQSRRPSGTPRGTRSSAASAARNRQSSSQHEGPTEEQRRQEEARKRAERRREAEKEVRDRAEKTRRPAKKKPSQPASSTTAKPTARARREPGEPGVRKKWNLVYGEGDQAREFPLRHLAIIIFAAIAVLVVATPLNQYMAQQEEKRQAVAQLEATKERIVTLEEELARWEDPQFVQSQARERLGYVMPGQTLYVVSDAGAGSAEERLAQRVDEVNRERRAETPFYVTMLDSITIAGEIGADNPEGVPILQDPNAPTAEPEPSGGATSPTPSDNPADSQTATP